MGGERKTEVEVIDLPWSLADLKFLFEQAIGETIDERKFRRWRKFCFVRQRQGMVYRPYDLAKLIWFSLAMRRFNNCKACQALLIKELETNVEYWNWARKAGSREWFERSGVGRAS